jgi:hypothetical protein
MSERDRRREKGRKKGKKQRAFLKTLILAQGISKEKEEYKGQLLCSLPTPQPNSFIT